MGISHFVFGGAMAITLVLARLDPALLEERMKPPIQPGQPLWDRIFLCAVILLWLGWLILMGLDAVRFRWSVMPIWLQLIGLVGIALSSGSATAPSGKTPFWRR